MKKHVKKPELSLSSFPKASIYLSFPKASIYLSFPKASIYLSFPHVLSGNPVLYPLQNKKAEPS